MSKIIIFGACKIAEIAHFYFTHDSQYQVEAFVVDREFISSERLAGLPVIAFEDLQKKCPPDEYQAFVAISYTKLNTLRAMKCAQLKERGYELVSYVSSKATIWPDFTCGENCFILENNIIQPFVRIGNNVILWSGNHIGHHTEIKDNCFIASQAVVSGGCVIKKNTFIGVNATIRDHVIVEENNIISAGACIMKNTVKNGMYKGVAAELSTISSENIKL